jgi:DNA-binding CsgD family transcriptional regulator
VADPTIQSVLFIVAAADANTRRILRSKLRAAALDCGLEVESASQLEQQLSAPEKMIVITGPSWDEAAEFARRALHADVPVLIWPTGADAASTRALDELQRLPVDRPRSKVAERLTARERQILTLIAAGVSNKGIARRLGVSPNTVKFHLSASFTKLGVTKRAEAIAAAARSGELSL